MTAAVVILGIAVIYLIISQILRQRELKRLAGEIEALAGQDSNTHLTVESRDAGIHQIAAAVNRMQQQHKDSAAGYIRMNEAYKQSMADISHDLRTPLTALIGYLKLLKRGGQDEAEQEQYIEISYDKAQSLHRLVNSLFELARLDSGAYQFELQSVDLQELLGQELLSYYPDFMEKGWEPNIEMASGPLMVCADSDAVKRVFGNLIQNALSHGSGGFAVRAGRQGNCAELVFSNEAPQLKADSLDKLFERAYTSDQVRTSRGGGLGLAIVKAFTEQMGGSVAAVLENGRLSLTLRFPLME